MEKLIKYIEETTQHLKKSLTHLEYSYNKILLLPTNVELMDEETLESWEGFSARFARTSDIFMMKYIKSKVKLEDPGFNGTFKDYLNQAEKLNLIDDATNWMKIREIRNTAAHEYSLNNLEQIFKDLKNLTPILLKIKSILP